MIYRCHTFKTSRSRRESGYLDRIGNTGIECSWTWDYLLTQVLGVYYGCIGANILENPDFWGEKTDLFRTYIGKKSPDPDQSPEIQT